MIFLFLYFVLGIGALIMGILAWRLKEQVYFIIGWICVGLMGVIIATHWSFAAYMIESINVFSIVIFGSVLGFPIYFLIQSKLGERNTDGGNIDGSTAGGAVTEDYLDEIINSPDEDVDYEEDLDLR